MSLIGIDDLFDQFMANNVLVVQVDHLYALHIFQDQQGLLQSGDDPSWEGLSVPDRPSVKNLASLPIRVRNIFIWAWVVFCASSKITKA